MRIRRFGEGSTEVPFELCDLSGFDQRLSLEEGGVLTRSTCSRLDEGDESTHLAGDLIGPALIAVPRGGPLDLGLWHSDPFRSAFTLELWLKV